MDVFYVTFPEMLVRVLLAIAFGAIIGWEREAAAKPAGLRTHIIISLGAAVFTLVTLELFRTSTAVAEQARVDPLRIVEGIVGGIGFLGAGTIIQARGSVEGITTAAGIWVVGAVGLACGSGYYSLAAVTAVSTVVILHLLTPLKPKLRGKGDSHTAQG